MVEKTKSGEEKKIPAAGPGPEQILGFFYQEKKKLHLMDGSFTYFFYIKDETNFFCFS